MSIQRRGVLGLLAGAGLAGCTSVRPAGGAGAGGAGEQLTLATTTSTDDTGLLAVLNGGFEDHFEVGVRTVALGTGAALETARAGDADVVLVHARRLEDAFLREGYGINRRDLMINDFVIVGPPDDPAEVGEVTDLDAALHALQSGDSTFISRGDRSGTHVRELELWAAAGIDVTDGDWYQEAGQGMGMVLLQASERRAYTLADSGTFRSMADRLDLAVHVTGPVGDGSERLVNEYGIMAVNPAVHPHVDYESTMSYIGFVTGPEGQELIDGHTVEGDRLFQAVALDEKPVFAQYVPADWSPGTE